MIWMPVQLTLRYLKGIGHSRGFGIQSPFAYDFVMTLRNGKKQGLGTIECIKSMYDDKLLTADILDKEAYQTQADAVLALENIYRDRQSLMQWRKVCGIKEATATFDLGKIGIVFFTKGLQKRNYIVNL